MELLQQILVYLTVGFSMAYLIKKFILPKALFASKKNSKTCGEDDCGCH